jgi:hypothetical protein
MVPDALHSSHLDDDAHLTRAPLEPRTLEPTPLSNFDQHSPCRNDATARHKLLPPSAELAWNDAQVLP